MVGEEHVVILLEGGVNINTLMREGFVTLLRRRRRGSDGQVSFDKNRSSDVKGNGFNDTCPQTCCKVTQK